MSDSKSPSLAPEQQAEVNAIITTYKAMRAAISESANKIGELDSDRNEHQLVIRAINDLDPNRRCYRSIGGVLVERTVAEVLPAVQKNLKGIEELINKLTTDLKAREQECDEYRIKNNIRLGEVPEENKEQEEETEEKKQPKRESSGVLA